MLEFVLLFIAAFAAAAVSGVAGFGCALLLLPLLALGIETDKLYLPMS